MKYILSYCSYSIEENELYLETEVFDTEEDAQDEMLEEFENEKRLNDWREFEYSETEVKLKCPERYDMLWRIEQIPTEPFGTWN